MIPSIYAVLVLVVGLVLLHYGTKGLSTDLASLKVQVPPPDVPITGAPQT